MGKTLTYVEIDYDFCGNTYGASPCAAVLGTTGKSKCFNTRATCQDPDNYDRTTRVLRFVIPSGYVPTLPKAIPSVASVSTTPARIRPGEDLGERASVSVTFNDHAYNDRVVDTYWAQRRDGTAQADGVGYKPEEHGTFWGKFRARNPYYRTRGLRIIQGELGQAYEDMTVRHYVMDSIKGPSSDGQFTITAKDVLKLADDKRAQCPVASKGQLGADISETATSATLTPSGIGDQEYGDSGTVVIGNEAMFYDRNGDTLTLNRPQYGTQSESHSQGDTVQVARVYDSMRASDIVADLLTGYARVPSQFVDLSAWHTEDDRYVGRLYGAVITEPTSVRDLLGQLCQQVGFSLWWDEVAQEIRFRVIRQPEKTPAVLTDNRDFLADQSGVSEQPDKRVSQVWVFYGVIDPTENVDEARNYRSVYVSVDGDAESESEYDSPQIKKIYARWISRFNQPAAQGIAERILSRYRDAPRMFKFSLPWNSNRAKLGSAVDTQTRLIQRPSGDPATTRVFVTSYEQGSERVNVEAEEFLYKEPPSATERRVVIDADAFNVDARTAYDDIYSEADTDLPIIIEVSPGVKVGSNSVTSHALVIDNFPSGADVTLVVNGRIEGKGGNGGMGMGADSGSARTGDGGGPALRVGVDIACDNQGGIWGGAGGGGGGGYYKSFYPDSAGGGGGGGAGYLPGTGGNGGNGANRSNGQPGRNGTPDHGGRRGYGYNDGDAGGAGGEPGQPGEQGDGSVPIAPGGPGGPAGNSIDGSSKITFETSGDIRGPQSG